MDGRTSPVVTRSLTEKMTSKHPVPDASYDPGEGTDDLYAPRDPSRAPGTPLHAPLQLQATEGGMEGQQSTQGTEEATWDQDTPSVDQLTGEECRELLRTLLAARGKPQPKPRGTPAQGASGHRVSPSPAPRRSPNMEPATLEDPRALEPLAGNCNLQLPGPAGSSMAAPRRTTPARPCRPQLGHEAQQLMAAGLSCMQTARPPPPASLEVCPAAPDAEGLRTVIQALAEALKATMAPASTPGVASLLPYPQGTHEGGRPVRSPPATTQASRGPQRDPQGLQPSQRPHQDDGRPTWMSAESLQPIFGPSQPHPAAFAPL